MSILTKLLDFQLLTPLTGGDEEWNEVADGVFQNKRCSHVFKQADRFDGKPYDIDGRIFREPNGCCYQNGESFVVIEFPYTPKREYVDAPVSTGGRLDLIQQRLDRMEREQRSANAAWMALWRRIDRKLPDLTDSGMRLPGLRGQVREK